MNPPPFSLGVVILAAGRSSRMGQPKLLMPWSETSILGHLLQQWRTLGAQQVAVVCAANDVGIQAELDRLNFSARLRVINPIPERGMFSSIQAASRWENWERNLTHWAIVLGDQPHLRADTLQRILSCTVANPDKICQPRKDGHRRHPVVLPKNSFERLANSTAAHLKDFLESCEIAFCEMTESGLDLDIDRPEDYQKARSLWSSTA
jgi:molybdenum cofactor cytidylyltransferase